jgi:hypothetical protein
MRRPKMLEIREMEHSAVTADSLTASRRWLLTNAFSPRHLTSGLVCLSVKFGFIFAGKAVQV